MMVLGHIGAHHCCCCHLTWDYNTDIIAIPDGTLTTTDEGGGDDQGEFDESGLDVGVVVDVGDDVIAISDEEFGGEGDVVGGSNEYGGGEWLR